MLGNESVVIGRQRLHSVPFGIEQNHNQRYSPLSNKTQQQQFLELGPNGSALGIQPNATLYFFRKALCCVMTSTPSLFNNLDEAVQNPCNKLRTARSFMHSFLSLFLVLCRRCGTYSYKFTPLAELRRMSIRFCGLFYVSVHKQLLPVRELEISTSGLQDIPFILSTASLLLALLVDFLTVNSKTVSLAPIVSYPTISKPTSHFRKNLRE
jgi:hypothetical protein